MLWGVLAVEAMVVADGRRLLRRLHRLQISAALAGIVRTAPVSTMESVVVRGKADRTATMAAPGGARRSRYKARGLEE